jgi:hypothetical protein
MIYYDKNGNHLERMQWVELFRDPTYQIIGHDQLEDGTLISTVWLGIDNAFSKNGPLIF